MAYNSLQELKVVSNDGTSIVLAPGSPGFGPEPAYPIVTITIAYTAGKAPSDAVAGATARVKLSIGCSSLVHIRSAGAFTGRRSTPPPSSPAGVNADTSSALRPHRPHPPLTQESKSPCQSEARRRTLF